MVIINKREIITPAWCGGALAAAPRPCALGMSGMPAHRCLARRLDAVSADLGRLPGGLHRPHPGPAWVLGSPRLVPARIFETERKRPSEHRLADPSGSPFLPSPCAERLGRPERPASPLRPPLSDPRCARWEPLEEAHSAQTGSLLPRFLVLCISEMILAVF